MAVAPSFQDFEKLCEPFLKNGRQYIKVRNPKTQNTREVRWYTDAEYAKAYPPKITDNRFFNGLKEARGYDKGPIIVIRNNKPSDEDWLGESCARYAVGVGWYITSTQSVPPDAPAHFKYLLLSWEESRDGDDNHIKNGKQLQAIVAKKIKAKEFVEFSQNKM